VFKSKIHDDVSLAHKFLHSIKSQKSPSVVLKLDPSESDDKVSWVFIRLAQIKMGMILNTMNWIMRYVKTNSFAILENGSPYLFFVHQEVFVNGVLCLQSFFNCGQWFKQIKFE